MATTLLPKASLRTEVSLAAIFALPSFAVVIAFCLRVFLCLLTHRFENTGHGDLQIIGREAGFVAWSLASGKGFAYPFPGYDAATAWLAPVFPALWSIGFRIFPSNATSGGVYFCQMMNLAFSAFTCWPIFWLGKRLLGLGVFAVRNPFSVGMGLGPEFVRPYARHLVMRDLQNVRSARRV
jgi:hypothetical protein